MEKTAMEVKQLNQAFIEKLGQAGGIAEIAKAGGEYIATKIKEDSFTDKVMPPTNVSPDECITDTDSETMYKLVPKKPEHLALLLNADGVPTDRWVRGSRVRVNFFAIKTEGFKKSKHEILAMERPVVEAIQDDMPKLIADAKDEKFVAIIAAAITANSKTNNWGTTGTFARSDLVALINELDTTELKADSILIPHSVLNQSIDWDASEVGYAFVDRSVREGWHGDRLGGLRVIPHIKNSITQVAGPLDRVWAFCHEFEGENLLGVNYLMQDGTSPLLLDVNLDQYSWMGMQYCAFDIINQEAVAQAIDA